MEKPPAVISYLNKSYKEAREELLSRAPIVSKGIWTDINSAELLVALLELVLGVSDMQMFYFDHQANEAFLPTARERKNVIKHTSLIGYRMKSWSPARGTVTLALANATPDYIPIPKYTIFRSNAGLKYYSTVGTYLNNAEPYVNVPVAQGEPRYVTYVSNGEPDQEFIIPSVYVAEGSVEVEINGVEWRFVDDDFAKSGPRSQDYILRIDEENYLHVVFGDGVSGAVPENRAEIMISWADTLGPVGITVENQVMAFESPIPNVVIVGSSRFSGGALPESIEEAKKIAPMVLRSLWRAVHKDDFIALAESFPGIRQAAVLDINDFPLYSFQISYHEVWVVAIPEQGEFLSEQLKADLTAFLDERRYVTCDVKVLDPQYIFVDVEALIFKYKGFDSRVILAKVEDRLKELFKIARSPVASKRLTGSVDGRVLGEDFRISKLIQVLQSVEGVSHVRIIAPDDDIRINYRQIARLGEMRINVLEATEEFGTPS